MDQRFGSGESRVKTAKIYVYINRGLQSRPIFFRDKTRWVWRSVPELVRPWQDYLCLVLLLGKIREKFGMGWDYTGKVLNGLEMNWNSRLLEIRLNFIKKSPLSIFNKWFCVIKLSNISIPVELIFEHILGLKYLKLSFLKFCPDVVIIGPLKF